MKTIVIYILISQALTGQSAGRETQLGTFLDWKSCTAAQVMANTNALLAHHYCIETHKVYFTNGASDE